jgi:hypothetical protein
VNGSIRFRNLFPAWCFFSQFQKTAKGGFGFLLFIPFVESVALLLTPALV